MQIFPELTTRKVLLVGHSQGTFYTNELYKYLIDHGVPEESIGVYNIATPADHVEGGGNYLTSANDKLINYVRELDAEAGAKPPLEANILIPLPKNEFNDEWGGHHFQSDYLAGAAGRIVKEIEASLGKLTSGTVSTTDGCFVPPPRSLSYIAQEAAFAVADPASSNISTAGSNIKAGAEFAAAAVGTGIAQAEAGINAVVRNIFFSVVPRPNAQSGAAALAVQEALYGSSLSTGDYADLRDGTDTNIPRPLASPAPSATGHTTEQQVAAPPPPTRSGPIPPQLHPSPPPQPYQPGFGGGGANLPAAHDQIQGSAATGSGDNVQGNDAPGENNSGNSGNENQDQNQQQQEQQQQQHAIPLTVHDPPADIAIAATSITFSGTTDPWLTVAADTDSSEVTTTADAAGHWSLTFTLAEGTYEFSLAARRAAGDASASTTRRITVDLMPPAVPVVSIPGCGASLSTSFCLLATTTPEVAWTASNDSTSFSVYVNGERVVTTNDTAARVPITDHATSTFEVVAYDAAGNAATSTATQDVVGYVQPAIINEIGWAGDDLSVDHSWFEVRNLTPYDIDLSHLVLRAVDGGSQAIPLSGALPKLTDINWDLKLFHQGNLNWVTGHHETTVVVPFDSFAKTGEELHLEWSDGATTTVDTTPPLAACGGWCTGALPAKIGSNTYGWPDDILPRSMERTNGTRDGAVRESWHTNDTYSTYGGTPRWGTPALENGNLPEKGMYCGDPSNVLMPADAPGPPFHIALGDTCRYLARFITFGVGRYGLIFRGDVSSSTIVSPSGVQAYDGQFWAHFTVDNPQPGEPFFAVIWSFRDVMYPGAGNVINHFTTGTPQLPDNPPVDYVVLPFTYKP